MGDRAAVSSLPRRLMRRIYERDNATCAICGCKTRFGGLYDHPFSDQLPAGSVDHIQPRSKGGGDEETNLRWACRSCNCSRGNRT